jgi:hypothetical protein
VEKVSHDHFSFCMLHSLVGRKYSWGKGEAAGVREGARLLPPLPRPARCHGAVACARPAPSPLSAMARAAREARGSLGQLRRVQAQARTASIGREAPEFRGRSAL